MKDDYHYGALIGMLSNEIRLSFSGNKNHSLLTGRQGQVLHYIFAQAEVRNVFQRDIELDFNIRRSSASSMLANMEKLGVIRREGVSYDARLKRIVITEKGEELKAIVKSELDEMEHKLTKDISQQDLEVFNRVMHKMIENLKEDNYA